MKKTDSCLIQFRCTCQLNKSRPCWDRFTPETYLEHRMKFVEMTPGQ